MNSTFREKATDFLLVGETFFLRGDKGGSTHAGGEMRCAPVGLARPRRGGLSHRG